MSRLTDSGMRLCNVGCGRCYHPDWTNIDLVACSPDESRIPDFDSYQLDRLDGKIRKPDSLFLEVIKPTDVHAETAQNNSERAIRSSTAVADPVGGVA